MTTRERFEHWFKDGSKVELLRNGYGYKYMEANRSWVVWQKATEQERELCSDICRELYLNDGITCAEYIMERD